MAELEADKEPLKESDHRRVMPVACTIFAGYLMRMVVELLMPPNGRAGQ